MSNNNTSIPTPPVTRKPVQVVDASQTAVYDTLGSTLGKKRPRHANNGTVTSSSIPSSSSSSTTAVPPSLSVHSLAKEVNTLGSTALNKWQKKEWERKELEKKGFMPPPNMKVPFKMYLGMKAKQEKRQEKRRQEQIDMGLDVPSLKKQKRSLSHYYEHRQHGDESGKGLNMKIGKRGRDGILKFDRSEISKVNSMGRGKKPF